MELLAIVFRQYRLPIVIIILLSLISAGVANLFRTGFALAGGYLGSSTFTHGAGASLRL